MPNQTHSYDHELIISGAGADDEGTTILVTFEGEIEPYVPATGPSYSSGGEPAEGGYAILNSAILIVPENKDCPEAGLRYHGMSWLINVLPQKELDSIAESLYDDWNATKGIGE